ncbi:unnamed protein product, partial [Choristocarpus tenellus]
QLEVLSFCRLLSRLAPVHTDRLLVLGCGAGALVLAGALLYSLDSVQGLNPMPGCIEEARTTELMYAEKQSEEQGGQDLVKQTHPSRVCLLEGHVLKQTWEGVTLLLICSASFDSNLMLDISLKCRELSAMARVVTLGKPLPSWTRHKSETEPSEQGEFKVCWQCQVRKSGDEVTVAYIHQR